MPTVLREGGFQIKINTDDHLSMHVHIWYQGRVLIVEFETNVRSLDNYGFNRREERQALEIIRANRDFLVEAWRSIHG